MSDIRQAERLAQRLLPVFLDRGEEGQFVVVEPASEPPS